MPRTKAGDENKEEEDDAEKQQVFDSLANALSASILDLATRKFRAERMTEGRRR
jgi:hypothetical protein